MIVSCEIMFFVNVCSNMIETKMFVLNGTIFQNKISPVECQNQNIFITDKNWWISLYKSRVTGGPLRNRSDFNQALSTLNSLHRESGGQQLRPMPCWKYKQRKSSSSSPSHLVAMERILVVVAIGGYVRILLVLTRCP